MATVIDDIRQYLIDENVVEESHLFAYEMPDTSITGNDYNATLLEVSRNPNPRYTRDEVVISIQVMGGSRGNMRLAQETINNIFNKLLGNSTIYVGTNAYYQFNSTSAPRLVGYQDNSKPFFTCSLSLVRESTVDEGNRNIIC